MLLCIRGDGSGRPDLSTQNGGGQQKLPLALHPGLSAWPRPQRFSKTYRLDARQAFKVKCGNDVNRLAQLLASAQIFIIKILAKFDSRDILINTLTLSLFSSF